MKINKITLIIVLFIVLTNVALAEKLYSVSLINTDQGLAYSSVRVVEGSIPLNSEEGTITVEISDFSGKVLYKNKVSPQLFQPFQLLIPYYDNGKEITIISDSDTFLSIDVNHFAETCNNEICEEHENFNICPEDCSSGKNDGYCDKELDYTCDPDCTANEDLDCQVEEETISEGEIEEEPIAEFKDEIRDIKAITPEDKAKESKFPWWIIIIILSLLFIIIIIFLIIKDKKKHEKELGFPLDR